MDPQSASVSESWDESIEKKLGGKASPQHSAPPSSTATAPLRTEDAPYRIWGNDLEPDAVQQMKNACKLPVAVAGALMPDAHVGYGLPIGGVLATENAVIPYAVGVDIACRMKMTVLDLPVSALADDQARLTQRARARDALRRRRDVQDAAAARRDGRRLAGHAGHRAD